MDVATGFLNGELKKQVYMKQSDGFVTYGQKHLVCRLKRSIYLWLEAVIKMLECRAGQKVKNQPGFLKTINLAFVWPRIHTGIKYHFIREQVEKATVELQYYATEEMVADMLTEVLSPDRSIKLRLKSGVTEMPDSTCKRGVLTFIHMLTFIEF